MNPRSFILTTIIWLLGPEPQAFGQYPATTYLRSGYGNNMYGSKTAYFWKHPVFRAPVLVNSLMSIQFGGNTCTAIQVNVVSRHGARYTSADDMRAFTTLQNKLKAEMGDQTYSFMNTWTNKYPESQADLLTPLGKEEMDYLGERLGFQLRDLLTNAVDGTMFKNSSIKFSVTRKVRTQESAKSFQNGLARSVLRKNDTSMPVVVRDKILRFYEDCKRYDEVTATIPELTKFQNGPEMHMVRDEITAKLQMNSTLTVGKFTKFGPSISFRNPVLHYDLSFQDLLDILYVHATTCFKKLPSGVLTLHKILSREALLSLSLYIYIYHAVKYYSYAKRQNFQLLQIQRICRGQIQHSLNIDCCL